jgi:hypothetical protein
MVGEDKSFVLRYVGSRFNGARLPLDVLSDLPAFRDLLVSYAKDGWRKRHEGRERLPKGFDKSISFDLVAIEEGSAMPKLNWSRKVAQEMLPGFVDELEALVSNSYADIVSLVDGAGQNKFPRTLSSEHVRALNKLGSGLLDGERIEFQNSVGQDSKVVFLDAYRRRALITRVRETYQARFEGVGKLRGLHEDGSVKVSTNVHGELTIAIDGARIKDEFDGNIGADVQFSLQIELDNNDKFRSVKDVFEIEIIDSSLSNGLLRLAELSKLQIGWLNGDGAAPTHEAVVVAQKFLNLRPDLSSAFRIYPTVEGGILFEFEINGWDLSAEIQSNGQIQLLGVQLDGSKDFKPELFTDMDLSFKSALDKLVSGESSK